MKLYTSAFLRYGDHPDAVSIARKAPDWFEGKRYPKMYPPRELLAALHAGDLSKDDYIWWYTAAVLDTLTRAEIEKDLQDGAILLCWCSGVLFCHRSLVRAWLTENGIETEELRGGYYTKLSPAH